MEDKKSLRKKYTEIRAEIDEERRKTENSEIAEQLLSLKEYKEAETIFIYVSFGSEADTKKIIEETLSAGKRTAVPLCDTESHTMRLIVIGGLYQLKKGAYGIYEPDRELIEKGELKEISKAEVDLAVVPALCFDKQGNRLGYGGGYYDRFLKDFKGVSVGLAFSECMTDALVTDKHDIRVDMVVSAKKER